MGSFIDVLAGAIYDFFKFIITSICYLVAGMLIVGVPLYLIALVCFTNGGLVQQQGHVRELLFLFN